MSTVKEPYTGMPMKRPEHGIFGLPKTNILNPRQAKPLSYILKKHLILFLFIGMLFMVFCKLLRKNGMSRVQCSSSFTQASVSVYILIYYHDLVILNDFFKRFAMRRMNGLCLRDTKLLMSGYEFFKQLC